MRFKKEKNQPTYEVDPSITIYETNDKDKVEELFEKISSYSFITESLITGEPVDAVRTSDIYHILCTYFNVDPDSTSFRHYK